MSKKLIAIALVLAASFLIAAPKANALTLQEQIDALLAQIAALQNQLAQAGGGTGITGCSITSFTTNLSQGATGDAVKCLQIILNSSADTQVAQSGSGAPGSETTYFGALTKAAVVKFQDKYAPEVLTPAGLTAGTGYVGSYTRAKLNTMLSSGGGGVIIPPITGSALNVGVAADTPVSANVAAAANADFTKINLTAGSNDVSITKIYVTRTGLSANADVENVKIIDMNGVYQGSIGSFNTDNRAVITFTPALVIKAGQTQSYYISAGFVSGTTAGKTAILGIAAKTDITSNAADIMGNFPVTGNPMSAVSLTIGSATFYKDGSVNDSKPDAGKTDVILNTFKVEVGSTEDVTLQQITAMEAGTAALSDYTNIELYDVTAQKTLGTVASWDAAGRASWSGLGIVIKKGETHRFRIQVDIVSGAGLTANCDVIDGSNVLATVKGNSYGFYITPAIGSSWSGKGDNAQTINSGALTVTKSSATPATGNIAPASDQKITVFDFTAKGEEVRVSGLTLTFATTGFSVNEITNIKIYDENGNIVAGPKDLGAAATLAYTDTFIVPIGTHQYTVKVKISSAASTGDTVKIGINSVTAKGMTTNDTITVTTSAEGNTQSVAAGYLVATNMTQPVARNLAKGISDFVWAQASLDAGASGEDVVVTAIQYEDTNSSTMGFEAIDNAELWADLTSANSARGDIFETKITDTVQPASTTGANQTYDFILTSNLKITKGTFVKIAFVGDLSADSTLNDEHTVSIDNDTDDVTAAGADTGATVSVAAAGGSGQKMTVKTSGALTLTLDSSSPAAGLILDETDMITLGVWKLAASNVENLDLDSVLLTATGTTDGVDTYYFYAGKTTLTLIGTALGGASPEIQVPDGLVTIPANDYTLLTVKAKTNDVDGTAVQNGDSIQADIEYAGDIDTTGLSSGVAVDSTATATAAVAQKLYESYPKFTVDASSPSGTLIPSNNTLIAIFDVKAMGNKDVTFDGAAAPNGSSADDKIYLQVSSMAGTISTSTIDIVVKDQDGSTLDDPTPISGTNLAIDFTSKDFVIPAGETKKLYIYASTTGLTTAGDSIQAWFDDGGTAINWSINYDDGDYAETATIFKGDIYGGALVKP